MEGFARWAAGPSRCPGRARGGGGASPCPCGKPRPPGRAPAPLSSSLKARVAPAAQEQRLHANVATQRAGEMEYRAAHAVHRLDALHRLVVAAGALRPAPLGEEGHEVVRVVARRVGVAGHHKRFLALMRGTPCQFAAARFHLKVVYSLGECALAKQAEHSFEGRANTPFLGDFTALHCATTYPHASFVSSYRRPSLRPPLYVSNAASSGVSTRRCRIFCENTNLSTRFALRSTRLRPTPLAVAARSLILERSVSFESRIRSFAARSWR